MWPNGKPSAAIRQPVAKEGEGERRGVDKEPRKEEEKERDKSCCDQAKKRKEKEKGTTKMR